MFGAAWSSGDPRRPGVVGVEGEEIRAVQGGGEGAVHDRVKSADGSSGRQIRV